MSPWAKKGAPEPVRLSDSEHTMTKTAALRRRDSDADSSGQPGSAPAACCQTRTAPSRRGYRSICKPASPRPSSHTSLFFLLLASSSAGDWKVQPNRPADWISPPVARGFLIEHRCLSAAIIRGSCSPAALSWQFWTVRSGEMSRSFGIWKHFGS